MAIMKRTLTAVAILFLFSCHLVSPASVNQLTSAVYVLNGGSSSIGPAIRIDGGNDPPSISTIHVTLAPGFANLDYNRCLGWCQDERLVQANLLPPAIDLLALATFGGDTSEGTVGQGNCSAISITRNDTDRNLDGYGVIESSVLPVNFTTGAFSFSFVLTQTREGFVLLVPDQTDPSLPPSLVKPAFGIWITLYVDCVRVGGSSLLGDVIRPNPNINVFIGKSFPHPLFGGRLSGQLHGLYYHPIALTESQIVDFCSCNIEALVLPSLPDGITAQVSADHHSILLQGDPNSIPHSDAIALLRRINYTNHFDSHMVSSSSRVLTFIITESSGLSETSTGFIRLVSSDNNFPVVDLNGHTTPGVEASAVFGSTDQSVLVSPNATIDRIIERSSITPTFSHVVVQLLDSRGEDEALNATSSETISVVTSANSQILEIIGPGIPSDFNIVLQSVRYFLQSNHSALPRQRRVSYLAVDTEGRTNTPVAISTITFSSFNEPPKLSLGADVSLESGVVHFEEGFSEVQVAPNVTVTDGTNSALMSAEVILTSAMLSLDVLLATPTTEDISSQYNGDTGVLLFRGRGTLSEYQSTLSSFMFSSSDNPFMDTPADSLIRSVTIRASDGQLNSNTITVEVQFLPRNDAPVIALPNPVVNLHGGNRMVLIAPSADITDLDNRQLQNMTVELNVTGGVLNSVNQTARVLIYTQGSVEEFVSKLRAIAFVKTDARELSQTINIQACDFTLCAKATVTVELKGVGTSQLVIIISIVTATVVLIAITALLVIVVTLVRVWKKKIPNRPSLELHAGNTNTSCEPSEEHTYDYIDNRNNPVPTACIETSHCSAYGKLPHDSGNANVQLSQNPAYGDLLQY